MVNKRETRLRKRLALRFGTAAPERIAFTEDISYQGLFIKTSQICPPGSRIRIDLTMPDRQVVEIEGQVRWAKHVPPQMLRLVRKCGMGVRITRVLSGEEIYNAFCEEMHSR